MWQIWVLGYSNTVAHGLIGAEWPWLVTSEWLHYLFALAMAIGLILFLPGFRCRAHTFWAIALVLQIWHVIEHQVLLIQAQTHHYWFGAAVPTSVLQQFWTMSRPELHLFYNTVVTSPMVIALFLQRAPG